ncbi:MAG: UDP-galactopyranose mutase [bacterium]
MKLKKVLVVGAGFAGAVIARVLAESGQYAITIIDKRNHIGGNTYDPVCPRTGQRYHQYGPHLFHTNNRQVLEFASRFTDWVPYKHKVNAYVEGIGQVPMPINLDTLNKFYSKNLKSADDVKMFLSSVRAPIENPGNAQEYLQNIYGVELTELFFARYSKKMWDLELEEISSAVVRRLPIRYDANPYYFNDKYQVMPRHGYLRLFENLLRHPVIEVQISQAFDRRMEKDFHHVFNSMPIDEYFDYEFGDLPYRSIIFDDSTNPSFEPEVPIVNFTDRSKFTRVTKWALIPGLGSGKLQKFTYETPCSYKENGLERYYPLNTVDKTPQKTYRKYKEFAKKSCNKTTFIGRCGQYIYYNMDQVIANSLAISKNFLG